MVAPKAFAAACPACKVMAAKPFRGDNRIVKIRENQVVPEDQRGICRPSPTGEPSDGIYTFLTAQPRLLIIPPRRLVPESKHEIK